MYPAPVVPTSIDDAHGLDRFLYDTAVRDALTVADPTCEPLRFLDQLFCELQPVFRPDPLDG